MNWRKAGSLLTALLVLLSIGGAVALQRDAKPQLIPDTPRPVITGVSVQEIACGGRTTVRVFLNNYGGTTAVGTLKLYVDGSLRGTAGVEVNPYTPETETFSVSVPQGKHAFKAVLEYPGGSDYATKTVEVKWDTDCDGLTDDFENRYGINATNPDTDGDGVIDSRDVNPFRDQTITVYIFRARAINGVGDPFAHPDPDMSLSISASSGQWNSVEILDFKSDTKDTDKYSGKIIPGPYFISNLGRYAVGMATFNVPDDRETVDITFTLYDRDDDEDDIIDVSPTSGTKARITYNLKTGTWSGDDYPGDENHYFGYGHLSGCGDGSCGVTSSDPDKDVKVYSKYENILEKNGVQGEVLEAYSLENVNEIEGPGKKGWMRIKGPRSVEVVKVRMPNGKLRNFTLVNTHGAMVRLLKRASSKKTSSNATVRIASPTGVLSAQGEVITYSSTDPPDGEIWFVIIPSDMDGIPFWREIELNKELEAAGIAKRFTPSDGHGLGDFDLIDEVNDEDMYGDYDGDGVPNLAELLIGKDPAKRDILGIELNISVEWPMSDEDKKNLVYSIRKASDFVYDYTDGYAMITKVHIWDGKRNWDKADVRVHYTHPLLPQTPAQVFYDGWPQATARGGYWMKRSQNVSSEEKKNIYIMMSREFERFSEPSGTAGIGSVRWGRTLGHELGHYVFWLGDEYEDWHGTTYLWGYETCDDFACYPNWELYNAAPDSVMKHEWAWSELSTPKEYQEFHNYLTHEYGDWKPYTTDQWGNTTDTNKNSYAVDSDRWHSSAWQTVYKILTSKNLEVKGWVPIDDKGTFRSQSFILSNALEISFDVTEHFTPKTGPYTGVGYFMEVVWG